MSIGTPHLARTYAMNVLHSVAGAPANWAVDLRQGEHWVEIHTYATRGDATTVLDHLEERGFTREDLRVRKVG